jgi:hypothetical protein
MKSDRYQIIMISLDLTIRPSFGFEKHPIIFLKGNVGVFFHVP